jgi:hypothetical protein
MIIGELVALADEIIILSIFAAAAGTIISISTTVALIGIRAIVHNPTIIRVVIFGMVWQAVLIAAMMSWQHHTPYRVR